MPEALVIPGLVAIDPHRWEGRGQAELVRGPLAGKATRFELSDTKDERWLVPREVAARRGLRLPEQHPALAEFPRLRTRLAEAALVRVDEAARLAGATADAGICLGYHRGVGGGNLEVALDGWTRGFSAESAGLCRQAVGDTDDEDAAWNCSVDVVYDRVLQALTDGRYSLYDVDLAEFAARVAEPEFAAFEAELAEIEAMAAERRPLAESLLAALEAATGDTALLPGGYAARRAHEPAFTLRSGGDVTVIGGNIAVPAVVRWFVADVEDFTPPSRKARRGQAIARQQAQARWSATTPWLLAGGSLLALVFALAARC
ncbi:hypothetical protein OV203_13180 [Nannocystis sp. ILAH1]|uniref:hypothetical protein n=1 Tax=unclassified Nannocystis TaxID=2627009 RepID=UPI002270849D|nr:MULTISPECIES: hypothetical protein [unclassified Nannocystis]MCY0988084.1 hypothetical protein [Nannocystis sp. ILAH1]MCY1065534.1 hypothetical protein [Nannocystis sp. RBIL2]